MKLEPKYLYPYLSHDLKAIDTVTKEIRTVTIEHQTYDTKTVGFFLLIKSEPLMRFHKPILRPLSDLTKDNHGVNLRDLLIERGFYKSGFADGYNRYSYKIVNKPFGKVFKISNHDDWVLMLSFNEPDRSKYFVFNYLLENHFDVFNLIEKGLAIDINTLTNHTNQ